MESNGESSQEYSLKIDTIWSEADESLLIKEEIVSDLEPDCIASAQENSSSCVENPQVEDEGNCNGHVDTEVLSNIPLKKKVKNRSQRTEESDTIINSKLSCLHDTKNFKIVKRRLRCGDCRSLVCPECCKVMIPNLQSHFLGSGICSSGTYLCKLCSIIFHSLCALQAHIRIHTMDTPYVCPDCGLIYNNIYFLILHLLNKCYHVYKIVRYKCKQCPGSYFTPENFVQHIQDTHIHGVFRCLYCSSLFSNYDEFNYHMENLHQKQKVQYLNYFRCSLCSNMVIPRFMYQRHVAQHRENSEFYEVDYQCLCGETYSLIGAFRSHFSYCSKKGVLPPKWGFLQRKLRTQDVAHHENFQSREFVIHTLPAYSDEADYKKLALVKPDYKSAGNEDEEVDNGDLSLKSNCDEVGQTAVKNTDTERKDLYNRENEKMEGTLTICNLDTDNGSYKNLVNSSNKIPAPGVPQDEIAESFNKSKMSEAAIANCSKERETVSADKNIEENGKNRTKDHEHNDGDMSKIYDHIPCDHLGYVIKTQCPEPAKRTCEEDEIIGENFSPGNYRFVTELDEKTGIITTKTVPLEELDMDEEDNTNDDYDVESFNLNTTTKQYCSNDKTKFKANNSLSCPFCIVLFPKHNLTFQQFRLHLESYHPDAALNITVANTDDKTPDKLCSSKWNVENEMNNFCARLRKDVEDLSPSNNSNLDNCEREFSPKGSQPDLGQDLTPRNLDNREFSQADTGVLGNKTLLSEYKNESSAGDRLFHSLNEGVGQSEKFPADCKDGTIGSWGSDDCRVETVSTHTDLNSDNREFFMGKEHEKGTKDINKETIINEEKLDDYTEGFEVNRDSKEGVRIVEETPENGVLRECVGKMSPKAISDLDYEGETSKDSNWSGISGKDTRTNSPSESKTEEKERSRRESEVWSEFYESLMLAEKLKKRKNPSLDSEGKKKSVVSDYSTKRVVKKPKRYRESSESADSNEYSESDDDFLLENGLMDKIYAEDKGEGEDQTNKKQLLLNKLENVDGKLVDYLFDLVTKKEKLFELYKKHSTLRANRYGHDLRSYRKKVLNGIKQRGRPLKMIRYHELLKKKEMAGEKGGKESYQLKKPEFSPENKSNEKKRGRPRKYHEAAKLKERRRSDKEVDFIEKNFEREENDLSPSKRKRKLSSKLQYYRKLSDEKDDFSSGQVITNKPIDSNKKFTCAVCKEVFPGLTEFRVHIVVHRMEENTYQCMECGECFVVRPSLEKHLHAFHKIKNTEKYITDNQCCNIKVIEVDNEPLKENQCKVCKDQFDRPIDLTKHFRIHGMAFLKEFKKEGKFNEKRNM